MRLGMPYFISIRKVPDFYHAISAPTGEAFKRDGIFCEAVYTVDVPTAELVNERSSKHPLQFCGIECSCIFSRSLERMLCGIEISGQSCCIRSRGLLRGSGPR